MPVLVLGLMTTMKSINIAGAFLVIEATLDAMCGCYSV